MGKLEIKALYKSKSSGIDVKLSLLSFKEQKIFIIYAPALDLAGYGINEEEAKDSFIKTLNEFFRYTTNKNTLFKELKRLGWTKKKNKNLLKLLEPNFSTLLENNKNNKELKGIINKDFEKFEIIINVEVLAELV